MSTAMQPPLPVHAVYRNRAPAPKRADGFYIGNLRQCPKGFFFECADHDLRKILHLAERALPADLYQFFRIRIECVK